jgi:Bacterial Ig domain
VATPRQVRRRGRLALIIGAAVVALAVGAVAWSADTIFPDGDTGSASPNLQYGGGGRDCLTRGTPVQGEVTVNYNGNNANHHFQAGELLDVTLAPDAAATAAGITASFGPSPQIPSNWDGNDDSYVFNISTTVPASTVDGAYHVRVDVVGQDSLYAAGSGEGSGRPQYVVNVSCSGSVSNHAPTVSADNASVDVNEGSEASNTGLWGDADGDPVTLSASIGTVTESNDGTWSWSYTPDDGPADSQTVTITANDGHTTNTASFALVVDNVAPTMGSITGPTNVLTGLYSYTYGASATDPSNADTTAGFYWAWDPGSGTFGAYSSTKSGSPNTSPSISFSGCGSYTIRAKAKDKDNGEASPASLTVGAYDGQFKPPLTAGIYNAVQKGQVVPVKISIGCNGSFLTGLTPAINLKSGDADPATDLSDPTLNVATSVSAADTSGFMREVDGQYIYNLAVPSNAAANSLFTIYVRPFGGTSPVMMVVLKIRK